MRWMARTLAPNLGSLYSGCACYFLSGSTTVFDEPSGAACMPGAVSPCGLEAGAPPGLVLIGPVQPCGCNCRFGSGVTVRPVLDSGLSAVLFSGRACAHAIPAEETKQTAISAMRMGVPHYVSPQNQYTPLTGYRTPH